MVKLRHARHPQAPPPENWAAQAPGTPAPQPNAQQPVQGLPPNQGQPAQQGAQTPTPKKPHRVFFWFFLAVQALFLALIIAGIASSGTPTECAGLTGDELQICKDAGGVGTTIGVGLVIGLWLAVDFILAVTYAIFRLARRPSA
ncbi:MAG TPA: hypothetical protein DEQ61_06980 [Streptomyces sp.]|nr:hypothetical protein [Streptomyces sp.]